VTDLTPCLRHSRYAQRLLLAQPALNAEIGVASQRPFEREEMLALLPSAQQAALGDEAATAAALRRLRQRVMLRLMLRDTGGLAGFAEVARTMTTLAEVAIGAALRACGAAMQTEMGDPGTRMLVVGMGKLGGGELNVSSDIDLIFVYPEDAELPGGRTRHEYFSQLGKRLIKCLDEPTGDGRVFRVDMRLRPWGDSGPLAISFDGLEQYLVSHGREWERYAWIKARVMPACDLAPFDDNHEADLAALTRPFVFRKYLDYGSIGAMRELHAQIRQEVRRRDLAEHIKLGPGGIREVEFTAQVFQLIRGGRDSTLQIRPTLAVLALLGAKGLLLPETVAQLTEAYLYLRKLEHRLQYLEDAQTHELPSGDEDRALIAESMGSAGWAAFSLELARQRAAVTRHFEAVFADNGAGRDQRNPMAPMWEGSLEKPEATAQLASLGYEDAVNTVGYIAEVRAGSRYRDLPAASRVRYDALVPRLIQQAAKMPQPDTTLKRCLTLIETVSRRAAYLAMLDEHPQALERIAAMLSASSWAADYLTRHPILLDELLDGRMLHPESDWPAFELQLRAELALQGSDTERMMDILRETHHAQVFRLLAQDLAGALSVERLADHLSALADLILKVVIDLCWSQLPRRHTDTPHFAVIAYGKLGGKELGYASDLDIIFLYDDADDAAAENYARLAQRMNTWLSSTTSAGVLFETDLRLRPNGASGLLVSSIEAFRKYQSESAWVWEHQALTRARFSAGDTAVGALFEAERERILRMPRDGAALRDEVAAMRAKMLAAHPNKSGLFDIKHDAGGMIDIEFAVQFLVLAHAHTHPGLTRNLGNIALLRMAAELTLIPAALADSVRDAYREFRHLQHGLRLNGAQYARIAPDEAKASREATLALWTLLFGSARSTTQAKPGAPA
jgi:glutamate-ammonia-ligase adenylyltransferase